MSSKYGMGHSGYGLFYASELCALANGQFILSSDDDTLVITGRARQHARHARWRGTVVNMLVDTSAPVHSEEIWKKFPSEDDEEDWMTTYLSATQPPFIAMWHFGTRLYTRDAAKEILGKVKERVLAGTPISFENVTTVTPSFADEFFRVLFEEIGETAYRQSVKVAGASNYIRRLIELVLKNRPSLRGEGGLAW